MKVKNELGNRYGCFTVVGYTHERVKSNGCVKWLCKCRRCGEYHILIGHNLRSGKYNKTICCKKCRKKKVKKVNGIII